MAGHYYRSDHFSLARVGIPPFPSIKAICSKAIPRTGAARRRRTTPRTTITSPLTNIVQTGISAATPSWRDLALCWGGGPALNRNPSNGYLEMSLRPRASEPGSVVVRAAEVIAALGADQLAVVP